MNELSALLGEIRACALCAAHLPLGPRPVLRAAATARILIVGQAPGTRVHETGIPWNDPSGDRLRAWTGLDPATFYDESRIAIVPMGFCYPGRNAKGGDQPPRPECAPTWHPRVLDHLPAVRLMLLVGQYAQARYLGPARKASLWETVRSWPEYLPRRFPLPHPSWRNNHRLRTAAGAWFDTDLIPALQMRIKATLAEEPSS